MKRIIGRGWLYKRPDSKYWWVGYKLEGDDKPAQESTKCVLKRDAEEYLKQIELRFRAPELAAVASTSDRLTFAELFQLKLEDAELNNRQTRALKVRRHHLERFFGDYHAHDINEIAIMRYRSERKSAGAQVSTINRELQALRSAFNVAIRLKRLRADVKPNFPMFDESHLVRHVTISPDECARILEAVPEYLKLPVRFYHASGWRRSEIAKLRKDEIVETLDGVAIRLSAERSKNRTSRLLPLAGELLEVVRLAIAKAREDTPYLFYRDPSTDHPGRKITAVMRASILEEHRAGGVSLRALARKYGVSFTLISWIIRKPHATLAPMPIGDFRRSWFKACEAAGVSNKRIHDFRRTMITEMRRAGIAEELVMQISGHKDRDVFRRYNITNDGDVRDALLRRDALLKKRPAKVIKLRPQKEAVVNE